MNKGGLVWRGGGGSNRGGRRGENRREKDLQEGGG